MGPTEINDLPAHILLVHVVVVMIPLASLALVLSVLWPAARRRLGIVTPLLALIGLVFVPITTHAGEWLEGRLGRTELIEKHAHLGDQLLPYTIGLFLVALGHWLWSRHLARQQTVPTTTGSAAGGGGVATAQRTTTTTSTSTSTSTGAKVVTVVLAVLGIAAAVLNVWMVYRIGDSGSKAVWSGSF